MENQPQTADTVKRPHSIDLSLELEHQLALEEGDTGTPSNAHHNHTPSHAHAPSSSTSSTHTSSSSTLDAGVLASLVSQLRDQLARITSERDELLGLMSTYVSREADLKDALQDMTDRFTAAKDEVATAREQHASDEENIAMLRAKVEESRRGLMKLQTENRRSSVMSTMTLDLSRAGGLGASQGGPPTSRGAGFTPLTGSGIRPNNGHRRGASISSPGIVGLGGPNHQVTTPDEHPASDSRSLGGSPPRANRRMSGLFLRSVSPNTEALSAEALEAKRLRKELQAARDQLEETRAELSEANEARDASETCAKALRDFITENAVGTGAPVPPPPPAIAAVPKHEAKKSMGGWGFGKLWQSSATTAATTPGSTASGSSSTPLASIAGSPLSPAQDNGAPYPPYPPLTRKLTGFFGQRSSAGSDYAPSVKSDAAPISGEQTGSVSSVEEPVEPVSPDLGPQMGAVLVKADESHAIDAGKGGAESGAAAVAIAV